MGIDVGAGAEAGGDFAFPAHGHILRCVSGDILVYKPTEPHGTSEFCFPEDVENEDSKIFAAFYCSGTTVRGLGVLGAEAARRFAARDARGARGA